MFRQLLTMFALVTGLAAMAEPAGAATGRLESVQVESAAAASAAVVAQLRIGSQQSLDRQSDAGPGAGNRFRAHAAPETELAAIRLKADRARE